MSQENNKAFTGHTILVVDSPEVQKYIETYLKMLGALQEQIIYLANMPENLPLFILKSQCTIAIIHAFDLSEAARIHDTLASMPELPVFIVEKQSSGALDWEKQMYQGLRENGAHPVVKIFSYIATIHAQYNEVLLSTRN